MKVGKQFLIKELDKHIASYDDVNNRTDNDKDVTGQMIILRERVSDKNDRINQSLQMQMIFVDDDNI